MSATTTGTGCAPIRDAAVPGLVLRPLAPGETATVQRVFDGMSDRSRRLRFLAPVPRLSRDTLDRLADVDHDRHGCWVAELAGEPVGLGRYVRLADRPGVAEIALEVVDAEQGRGIGRVLRDAVAAAAADVGVTELLWVMDGTNTAIRALSVPLGGHFAVEYGVLEGTTPLPAAGGLDAVRIIRCARAARRAAAVRSAA
jgi:GNAT superfamily N-acetyltransferase